MEVIWGLTLVVEGYKVASCATGERRHAYLSFFSQL